MCDYDCRWLWFYSNKDQCCHWLKATMMEGNGSMVCLSCCRPIIVKVKIVLLLLITAAKQNHSDCDCFGVAILSHGDSDVIFGIDSTIAIDNLVSPIKHCQSLVGKPKIFFFQVRRYRLFNQILWVWIEVFGLFAIITATPCLFSGWAINLECLCSRNACSFWPGTLHFISHHYLTTVFLCPGLGFEHFQVYNWKGAL